VGDNGDVWEVGSGGFGEGGELFFNGDEGGELIRARGDGGVAGGSGQLVGYLVRHLLMGWTTCFLTEVSVLGVMGICKVFLLVWLKDDEFVGRIGVRAEERGEVKVRDLRSLSFSMEFGVSATQFD